MQTKVNLKEKFDAFDEVWTPKILAEVNESYVKIFKAQGDFVWHQHEDADEFFLVVKGVLRIKLGDEVRTLKTGEFTIVKRGVRHCPECIDSEPCHVLLFEPKSVINTGDTDSEKKVAQPEWI